MSWWAQLAAEGDEEEEGGCRSDEQDERTWKDLSPAERQERFAEWLKDAAEALGIREVPPLVEDALRGSDQGGTLAEARWNESGITIAIDPSRLDSSFIRAESWEDAAYHEMVHVREFEILSALGEELTAWANSWEDFLPTLDQLPWGEDLEAFREHTRPDDPDLAKAWDWYFDSLWSREHGPDFDNDGEDLVGEDGAIDPEDYEIYRADSMERDARDWARDFEEKQDLECTEPGDPKEEPGRSGP